VYDAQEAAFKTLKDGSSGQMLKRQQGMSSQKV
jgi:hypothetical protein